MASRLRDILSRRGVTSPAALHQRVTSESGRLPSWARMPTRRTVERHYAGQVRMTPQDVAMYLRVVQSTPAMLTYVITGDENLIAEHDPLQNSRQVAEIVRLITSFIPSAIVHVEPQYLSPRFGLERGRFVICYEDTLRPLRDPVRDVEWMRLQQELVEAGAEPQPQLLRRGSHTQRLRAILGLDPIEVTRNKPTPKEAERIAAAVRPPLLAVWVPALTRRRDPAIDPYRMRDGARVLIVCGYADLFGPSLGPLVADGIGWGFIDLDRAAARQQGLTIGQVVEQLLDGNDLHDYTVIGTRLEKSTSKVLETVCFDPGRAAERGVRLLLPQLLEKNILHNIGRDAQLDPPTKAQLPAVSTPLPVRGPVIGEYREGWKKAAAMCKDSRWDYLRERGLLWEIVNLPWLHYGTTRQRSEAGVATAAMSIGWLVDTAVMHPTSRTWTQLVFEDELGTPLTIPRQLSAEFESARSVGVLHRGQSILALPAPSNAERSYSPENLRQLPYEPMIPHEIADTSGAPTPQALAESRISLQGQLDDVIGIVAQV